MTKIRDITEFFDKYAPKALSESFDNDGVMLCKSKDTQVKKVLITLDVTKEAIEYATQHSFDLIISHHPFIFNPLKRIDEAIYDKLEALISGSVCVLSYHTRLDSAQGGVNDTLVSKIGLCDLECFGGESGRIGRIGYCEKTDAESFAKKIKSALGIDYLRACFEKGLTIHKVAVVSGCGKSLLEEAKSLGADAFVTSEFSHNHYLEAKELGIALFDAGHYFTENPVIYTIKAELEKEFCDIEAECFDIACPYITL